MSDEPVLGFVFKRGMCGGRSLVPLVKARDFGMTTEPRNADQFY